MTNRKSLLESIATTIADYREGEIPKPTPQHVERWVNQFPVPVQVPILAEMDQVLNHTYISKAAVEKVLRRLVKSKKVAGDDPCTFWKATQFLNIQGGGNSQRDMLELFDATLKAHCSFSISKCGTKPHRFVYLDDVLFTGNRILRDLTEWINATAPKTAEVHVVTLGLHAGGQYYASEKLAQVAKAAGKTITLHWWHHLLIEDRKSEINVSDVLRPTALPADADVQAYAQALRFPPVLRTAGSVGGNKFFSSEAGRNLLEQEMLKAGLQIREICPRLPANMRPLGYTILQTLGFGSVVVTFRNCPNNAPLALWAGEPWYPLFARKNN